MPSKMQRVYVPKFCEICGKEEFEGVVFGQDRARHLHAESGTREIRCDHHRVQDLKPLKIAPLADFFLAPHQEK